MRIGVITESEGESRVAIVPSSIRKLKSGYEVAIQEGAGKLSNYLIRTIPMLAQK